MTTLNLWNYRAKNHSLLRNDWDRWFQEILALNEAKDEPSFTPACDVQELEKHFLISMDVPGVKKEDIEIQVKDETLLVSGERKNELKSESRLRGSLERFQGKFHRAFRLGEQVDPKAIEASYEDGVLKICVPRKEVTEPEAFKIKVGEKLSKITH